MEGEKQLTLTPPLPCSFCGEPATKGKVVPTKTLGWEKNYPGMWILETFCRAHQEPDCPIPEDIREQRDLTIESALPCLCGKLVTTAVAIDTAVSIKGLFGGHWFLKPLCSDCRSKERSH